MSTRAASSRVSAKMGSAATARRPPPVRRDQLRSTHRDCDEPDVDLVILGGGSGGYAAALRAAELGMSVVLIEKDKVGGTCLHRGCIPTKALLHAGEIADQRPRERDSSASSATFEGIDMAGVHKYKDGVISQDSTRACTGLVKSRGIEIVEGEGRLVGPKTGQVGGHATPGTQRRAGHRLRTRAALPGLDIDGERVITSDHALQLDHVPQSAIVLGGGVIGCRVRLSVWKSFGADVTIVEALPHLVPLEDEASSKLLERAFRRRGIKFKLGARFAGGRVHRRRRARSPWRAARRSRPSCCSSRSAAARSRQDLGYEEHGVAMDRGFVMVDEYCRTNVAERLRGRRPASRPCSSRTSASPRASWSPSSSPG